MKVLLFVQTGGARPKCVGAHVSSSRRHVWYPEKNGPCLCVTHRQQRAVESADRWWLVECRNADEGRREIDRHRTRLIALRRGMDIHDTGRILASGGKR